MFHTFSQDFKPTVVWPDSMIPLFLTKDFWEGSEDDDTEKLMISLVQKMESVIRSVILNGGRSEARQWLCKTLSGMKCFTPSQQCELFVTLLKSKHLKERVSAHLLQMLFDKAPHKAGQVLAKTSSMLENFFKGNPERISAWFSGNACDLELSKGVKALSQFAFVNRDICWDELEWKGKHGQSPAVVATKPHYFLDLDLQRTVENFLEYVPEFWSSKEFSDSLKDGAIVFVDTRYFIEYFNDLMYDEDSEDVWDAIRDFLMGESFASLCNQFLIVLKETDFLAVLKLIRKFLNPVRHMSVCLPTSWFEIILPSKNWDSIDELLLLNTVINHGRQLLRNFQDEEFQEEKSEIHDVMWKINANLQGGNALASIIRKCYKTNVFEVIKWLGLQSWAIHFRLSLECSNTEFWESLFAKNGISFRKSDSYALLCQDRHFDGSNFGEDEIVLKRKTRKTKGRSRKKRKVDSDDSFDSELLDLGASNSSSEKQVVARSWYLSTDEYLTLWSTVDLPEHISNHCFCTWWKFLMRSCAS
ncbi:unnamed protein product [Rhodiola kirilowii]